MALAASTVTGSAVPSVAARGGGSDAGCVPVLALDSGEVDRPASRTRVTPQLAVSNCGPVTATLALRVVPTRWTLRSVDPYVLETCTGAAYGGQSAKLRPGETRTLTAPAVVPSCASDADTSPWGVDLAYSVDHDVTLVGTSGTTVAGSAVTTVQHAGGT